MTEFTNIHMTEFTKVYTSELLKVPLLQLTLMSTNNPVHYKPHRNISSLQITKDTKVHKTMSTLNALYYGGH